MSYQRRNNSEGSFERLINDPYEYFKNTRQRASNIVEESIIQKRAVNLLGSFYDADKVKVIVPSASIFNIEKGIGFLRLRTSNGYFVYPEFQFYRSHVIKGLPKVLLILHPGIISHWTVAWWLVSPSRDLKSKKPIDLLRKGQQDCVYKAARAWAYALETS